jgi:NADH dehydrogenase [ubiquinone] 1 alpha subcomplex assembly factor 7
VTTPLASRLLGRIAQGGPMTLAEYMAECLLDPIHGYYTTAEPFGRAGDFVTAPEISQMFGELLGLCLAQAWIDRGAPAPFALVELGPGRGTLMADLWRATRAVPGFHAAARLTLVEASPRLRALQARRLDDEGVSPAFAAGIDALPDLPLFLVANEFFDALPIRQFLRQAAAWHERLVGTDGDRLVFGLSPPLPSAPSGPPFAAATAGTVVETCPAGQHVADQIGGHLRRRGGVALIVDYGDWRSSGDTLQALYRGAFDPPLAHPGQADLTAHVDFEALALAARVAHSGMTPQGRLLGRLGIAARADRLAAGLSGAGLASHRAAVHRLTDAGEMGTLFKALALSAPGQMPVPGFDPGPQD